MKLLFRPLKKMIAYGQHKLWQSWYHQFDDNPFKVDLTKRTKQSYLALDQEVQQRSYPEFMAEVEQSFGQLPSKSFVDQLALSTQVTIKKSPLLYLHGYLLYAALIHYLANHPELESVTILETGTARGFSALCMAKALEDAGRPGKIITIDLLHAEKPIYWNCIHDFEGKHTRLELLAPWHKLVEKYLIFMRGSTDVVLSQLGLTRVHFAFLDGGHTYQTLHHEMEYVMAHQQAGDVIVCDDYSPQKYTEVVQAIDELLALPHYTGRLFESGEGRAYVHCQRNITGITKA